MARRTRDVEVDLANAPTRLGTLLDTILATDEHLLLVFAQIVPATDDAENARVRRGFGDHLE